MYCGLRRECDPTANLSSEQVDHIVCSNAEPITCWAPLYCGLRRECDPTPDLSSEQVDHIVCSNAETIACWAPLYCGLRRECDPTPDLSSEQVVLIISCVMMLTLSHVGPRFTADSEENVTLVQT